MTTAIRPADRGDGTFDSSVCTLVTRVRHARYYSPPSVRTELRRAAMRQKARYVWLPLPTSGIAALCPSRPRTCAFVDLCVGVLAAREALSLHSRETAARVRTLAIRVNVPCPSCTLHPHAPVALHAPRRATALALHGPMHDSALSFLAAALLRCPVRYSTPSHLSEAFGVFLSRGPAAAYEDPRRPLCGTLFVRASATRPPSGTGFTAPSGQGPPEINADSVLRPPSLSRPGGHDGRSSIWLRHPTCSLYMMRNVAGPLMTSSQPFAPEPSPQPRSHMQVRHQEPPELAPLPQQRSAP